ncbi:MAG: YncE family protein [Candidatus Zixiibacteriota bacterium]|jgi:DNA-binding beta-propeller fold protein YncE
MLRRSLFSISLYAILFTASFSPTARADRFAYVINNLGKTLSKINLTTNQVVNDIEALGEAPNQVVIQGDNAYVVNSLDHNIQIIDLTTENTTGYIIIGEPRNPFHVAFVDSQYAYVTNLMTNTISKVDVINKMVVGEYGIGLTPEGLMVVGDKLYVCCTGFQFYAYRSVTGRDWVFDATHRANNIKAYSYITGKVYVFDLQAEEVVDSISVGMNPQYLDLDPEGELNLMCTGDYFSVFGQIYRIDTNTDTVIDSIATGGSPGVISIGTDGVGYLAAGGWNPNPGEVYTFDSYADTMIRGSSNPVATGCGVMSVTALHPSQVLACSFDADDINRLNRNGNPLNQYLVGDGPISTAIYVPSPEIPIMSRESLLVLIMLLALAGSMFLNQRV